MDSSSHASGVRELAGPLGPDGVFPGGRMTVDDIAEAQRLKLGNPQMTWTEIGDRLGVHRSTVQRAVERNGFADDRVSNDGLSHEALDSEIVVIKRDYSHLPSLRLYPLGDVHKGDPTHQVFRWRQWLEYLAGEEDASLLLTGDLLNAALKDSKSEAYEETMTVGRAKRELIAELAPLAAAGRIDVAVPGNHEARIHRAIGDCPVEDLCDRLAIPYARSAVLLLLTVGSQTYRVYLRHGTGNAQNLAGLTKGGNVILADLYLSGHTHRMGHTVEDIFDYDQPLDRVVRRHRHFVVSGSFMGYARYAAERGYAPAKIGAPRIFLDGEHHDIKVSM